MLSLFRYLRFSSTWGLVTIFYPIVFLLSKGMGIHDQETCRLLFGLILSFGIWCNQTLPTGDTVEITAEIQGLPAEDMAALTQGIGSTGAMGASIFLVLLFVVGGLVDVPPWCMRVAAVLAASAIGAVVYWKHRKSL